MSCIKPLRRTLLDLDIQCRSNCLHDRNRFELRDPFYEAFLDETLVEVKTELKPIIELNNQEKNTYSYQEFIESILGRSSLLMKSNNSNTCESSFLCNLLTHHHWETLCLHIGRQNFFKLLCALSCFKQTNGISLYLPLLDATGYKNQSDKNILRISRMYYKWRPSIPRTRLMTTTPRKLLFFILDYKIEPRNVPKKYRKFLHLMQKLCQNETKLDYPSILSKIQTRKDSNRIFENCTPFDKICQFVILAMERIFPHDAFGCAGNQKLVKVSIINVLKTSKSDAVNLDKLLSNMKLSTIKWLGKSDSMSSLQDLSMRRGTFRKFLRWVHANFLTSVVSSFWYVTENVNNMNNCGLKASFFLHNVWRDLTMTWLTRYSSKYLCEVSEHDDIDNKQTEFNFGILRLVPKKSDFRPLCVPLKRVSCIAQGKDADDEKGRRAFKFYDFNFIRPIRDILRFQQAKKVNIYPEVYPRCYSVRDIGKQVGLFKKRLLRLYEGKIPVLHGVQFDMKHCYDNLNQAKIISCIEDLFESEHSEEKFIVKRYSKISPSGTNTKVYKRTHSSIKQRRGVEELDFYTYKPAKIRPNEKFLEKPKIFKFSKNDVLDVVRNQVLESVMKIPELGQKHFKRTIGVYQGLPLLETFCDIVYNALVDDVFTLERREVEDSLLLRLSDDFLFLSAKKSNCDMIMDRANSVDTHNYGAFVNQEKCHAVTSDSSGSSSTNFLGLEIELKDLSIRTSDLSRVALSNNSRKSIEATLAYLEWRFKLKLSDYLLDTNLLSIEVVAANIKRMVIPIINCAMSRLRTGFQKEEIFDKVEVFLYEMIYTIVHEFEKVNESSSSSNYILEFIWNAIASHAAKEGLSMHRL